MVTTTAPTTAATTVADPAVLGASRALAEETDPSVTSESATDTTAAPTATPTPAVSGSVASTGEAASHTVLIGTVIIAAAALCFVFYVRKEKKHS